MGSLDVSSAKDQFFQLVDAISASHLPAFTIWLDAKLAEYKTIGQLKRDSEYESKEQYPEWIGKALRQNLSFLFPDPSQTASSQSNASPSTDSSLRKRRTLGSSDLGSESKRSKHGYLVSDRHEAAAAAGADDLLMVVKEEPGGKETTGYSGVSETPLPGIQSAFSLSTEHVSSFTPGQSAAFSYTTASESLTSSPATMTSPNQTLSASLPRHSFPDNAHTQQGSSSKRLNFDGASAQPLFSLSAVATKLEDSPQLSAPSPGDVSAEYPVSSGAGQSSDADGFEGGAPEGITDEAVQDAIQRYHRGKPTFEVPTCLLKNLRNSVGSLVCPVCQKLSRSVSHYREHFVTHTDERPFLCVYCQIRFKKPYNLTRHQKLKHGRQAVVKPGPAV